MDGSRERLLQIDGAMPRLNAIPAGCAFNPRCPEAFERCRSEPARSVACSLDARRLLAARRIEPGAGMSAHRRIAAAITAPARARGTNEARPS